MAVTITIKGADQTAPAFTTVIDGLEGIGGAAEGAGEQTSGFFSGMLQTAGGFLAANVIGGIAASFTSAAGSVLSFASDSKAAINDFKSQLGLTQQEAETLGQVAESVFANNFGDSMEDAAQSVGIVKQQLGELVSAADMQGVTENALRLRDSFGLEVNESVSTARTLMENFGLTSQQAFDFIAKGQQEGLNRSGDFLDTINEYSTQFSNSGASAEQFFSLLDSGLQGGTLGTDKAADAFKEFGLRIADGSASTETALQGLGINADELWGKMSAGQVTTADAFTQVITQLNQIEDPVARNAAGIALLGTQYEDLGASGALGLSLVGTSLNDLSGATDSLNAKYDNWGSLWEGIQRQVTTALSPISESLLAIASDVMPLVSEGFASVQPYIESFAETVAAGIGQAVGIIGDLKAAWDSDFGGIRSTVESTMATVQGIIDSVMTTIAGFWTQNGAELTSSAESTWSTVFATIQNYLNAVWGVVQPILQIIQQFWIENGDQIMATVAATYQQIAQIVQTAMALLNATIIPALQAIGGFISSHSAEIQALLRGAWTIISTIVSTTLSTIQGVITATLQVVQGDWSGAWQTIQDTCATIVEGILTIIETQISTIQTIFGDAINATIDLLQGAVQDFLDVGRDMAMGVAQGFERSRQAVIDAIWGSVQGVINWIKDQLGIHSPSDVTAEEIGLPFALGIASGIADGEQAIQMAIRDIGDTINDAIQNLDAVWQDTLNGLFSDKLNADLGFADLALSNEQALQKIEGDAFATLQSLQEKREELIAKRQEAVQDNDVEGIRELDEELNNVNAQYAKIEQQDQARKQLANQAREALQAARAEADNLYQYDPAGADKLYELSSKYILQQADLKREIAEAQEGRDSQRVARLQRQFELLEQKAQAEVTQLSNTLKQNDPYEDVTEARDQLIAAYNQEGRDNPGNFGPGWNGYNSRINQGLGSDQFAQPPNQYNYTLNITTNAPTEPIVQDFMTLQAMNPQT